MHTGLLYSWAGLYRYSSLHLEKWKSVFSSLTDSSRARQQGAQEVYVTCLRRKGRLTLFFFSIGIVVYVSWEVARKPRGQTKHISLSLSLDSFLILLVFSSLPK
jgi:hypothetical protein